MANAKKCDRCGKFFVPYIESEIDKFVVSLRKSFGLAPYASKIELAADMWDLCSDCRDSFARWFAMKGEDN